MDTKTRGEQVEADLDRLITKRHDLRMASEEQTRIEDGWAESVRVYNALQEAQSREAWAEYHRSAAERIERTAAQIAAEHRARAEMLLPNGHKESA